MKKPVLLYLVMSCYSLGFSQSKNNAILRSQVAALMAIRELKPIEKIYLQTDKPYYTTGDTLRFKAYLLNADYLTPSNRTGLLYLELDDPAGKAAKRIMVPVTTGLAWGDIALDEKDLPHGNYTLRAYTNWMRNFGEDYIYKQTIAISAVTGNALLLKANFARQGNKVESVLQFTSLDGHLQLLKDMELRVMNGRKNLSKDKLTTGVDGALKVNFDLPVSTADRKDNFSIIAKDVTKGTTNGAELIIPINLNRPENTDIQFMPEGGNLVVGIKTKVGFKAISEDGKGTSIGGKIIDSKQNEVASFKTSHAGMGSFEFTPKTGETYVARLNGINKTYPLPAVSATGTALRIEPVDNDSLKIVITGTADSKGTYYLIGQARGVVCYAQAVTFDGNGPVKKSVAKNLFPTGIARFTLLNADRQPLNERQVFINQNDNLQFSVTTNKPGYGIRDSLALAITVKDKNGRPVKGDFSLAVTDDNQVKTDSMGSNILNNLLLTSDLKGDIEEPGYYFTNATKQKQTDLDNLLLTQGWVGYNWNDVFKPIAQATYQPEKEFIITGTVTNVFNKPVEKSPVVLYTNHPLLVQDTLTDKEGRFTFKGLFPVDTAFFKLQARNKRNKEFNVGINIDGFKPPEFAPVQGITPWYVNSDSIRLNNSKSKAAQLQSAANYRGEGRMLKEVTIKDKRIVKGSLNLNGPGEADQIFDEQDMEKAGKMTLEELLKQKVKGFIIGNNYKVDDKEPHFIIDGMDLDYFFEEDYYIPRKKFFYLKSYLDYFTAEDILGIEVMYNTKYSGRYWQEFITFPKYKIPPPPDAFAFIEITTRAKKGPFMKVTPGTYLYKALPFTLPKQFYSPKYTVKNKAAAMGTDRRSTLYWEPNVLTDADGKATVSFFTADKPANYTVTMEGITGDGNIGYHRQKIKSILTNTALK